MRATCSLEIIFTPRRDRPSALGVRKSGKRPSRRTPGVWNSRPLRSSQPQGPEAPSGSHGEKHTGKIYPSRSPPSDRDELSTGAGRHADDRDDPAAPPGSAGDADWRLGAAGARPSRGSAGCNSAGHDHNGNKDKTRRRTPKSDRRAVGRPRTRLSTPVRKRSTGQPAPIMAGWHPPMYWRPAHRATNEKPRLRKQPGFSFENRVQAGWMMGSTV